MPIRLVLITDEAMAPGRVVALARQALERSSQVALQLRRPGASAAELLALGRELQSVCTEHRAPFFINGRLDVALSLGAHLHLPAHGVTVTDARSLLPEDRLVSVAVHDEAEARAALGADFALVSPVFAPGSKPLDARPPLGPSGFTRLLASLPCPAFALGGITAERMRVLPMAAGAAVVSAVWQAADPAAAVRELLNVIPAAPSAGG